MRKLMHVGDVYQLNGRVRVDASLARCQRTGAQVRCDDWCQYIAESVVQVGTFLEGDVDIDFLLVAGRGGRPTGRSSRARLSIDSASRP